MPYSISELNQMEQETFVEVLGPVFEATPAIARQAWASRPFADLTDLHQHMLKVVTAMSPAEQLTLIRSHPDLGSKAKMADASVQEQAGAGLNQLTLAEYERFQKLNQAYKDQFGFPFIVAVKNHTKESILAEFDRRLGNSKEVEMQQALTEITQIARWRLLDLVKSESPEAEL